MTPDQQLNFQICVADEGMGVPEEDRKNLFKPFFQTKNKKSKKQNTQSNGLGLSICKRIANRLGGDLTCTGGLNRGSEFVLSMVLDAYVGPVGSKQVTTKFNKQFGKGKKLIQSASMNSLRSGGKSPLGKINESDGDSDSESSRPELQKKSKKDVRKQQSTEMSGLSNATPVQASSSDPTSSKHSGSKGSFENKPVSVDNVSEDEKHFEVGDDERIIVAEDQLINMEVIKQQLKSCKKFHLVDCCINGEDALNMAKKKIEEGILKHKASKGRTSEVTNLRPIKLMLLDFQMPRLNGIQVVEHLRAFIKEKNRLHEKDNIKVRQPRIVFLTAFLTSAFKAHITKLGIKDAYEKPCQLGTLKEILGIEFRPKNDGEESEMEGQSVMSVHEPDEEADEIDENFKFKSFA